MTIEQRTTNFRTLNPVTATTREIAEVLQCSEKTVETRLYRARKILRGSFDSS